MIKPWRRKHPLRTKQDELIGKKIYRWTVVNYGPRIMVGNRTRPTVECQCECGRCVTVRVNDICDGKSKQCAKCQMNDIHAKMRRSDTHKALVSRWSGIKRRCFVASCTGYKNYGGRGIKMCEEWLDFEVFKTWALQNGFRKELTIERVNNDGNYEPSNCTWIPFRQQAKNRRPNSAERDWRGRFIKS